MKIYTEADVKEAVKVLFFEGAGCAERGDVENCRIRTAFTNDNGERFYLELSGVEVTHKSPERFNQYLNMGFVDYCYQLGEDGEKIRFDIEKHNFEYSKADILDFVNTELGCSFTEIYVTDLFYWYLVHKQGGGYNLMEDHNFDHEKATRARNAFNEIDMKIRRQLGERYSKISLHEVGENYIKVRCYASNESMLAHGMDPDNRFITVQF